MNSRGMVRGAVAGVLAAALVVVPTAVASADDAPNWWYDAYDASQAHAEGWTGKGVKVAVIDGQINSALPVFQGADVTVGDEQGICGGPADTSELSEASQHGSTAAALIVGNGTGGGQLKGLAPDAALSFYGYGSGRDCPSAGAKRDRLTAFGSALKSAIDDGNTIVSTSVGFSKLSDADVDLIAKAINHGVIIVAATVNSTSDNADLPAAANGVVAVNAIDSAGNIQNDHESPSQVLALTETTVVAAGVGIPSVGNSDTGSWDGADNSYGSSLATPIVAAMLAMARQKYPDATANQLIQSLIHNTGAVEHPLARDQEGGYGYGPVSLTRLLSVDPSAYPDKNPLADKEYGAPSPEQLAQSPAATTAPPSDAATSEAGAVPAQQPPLALLLVLAVVGALILIVIVVMIVVLVRRTKRIGGSST